MKEPLIFDTSVWIDFLNKKKTAEATLLEEYISLDGEVLLVPVILQEILQGIRDDTVYARIKETLSFFTLLELPAYESAVGAADLYRSLRKEGITIRKSNDCAIAFYAIRFSVRVIHTDRDFDEISKQSALKVGPKA
ncbi:Ribonuclease VapC15 [compost metagenome]